MTVDMIIFGISAIVAVLAATLMIAQRNPVASVLYLILSLVAQAACFVQLGAVFMGAIMIVVYAGAIAVLFLFVIMLLNLRGQEDLGSPARAVSRFTRYAFGILLTMELAFVVKGAPLRAMAAGVLGSGYDDFGSVEAVATLMFTKFVYPFELTGVLLLAAIVGAVVIAKTEKNEFTDKPVSADKGATDAEKDVVK